MKRVQRLITGTKSRIARLRKDKGGLSAIEFTLLFPIILILFAATEDLGQALMVDRKMNEIAATASDLVAQKSSWTTTTLDAILAGTATIIEPFSTSKLTVLVAVVNVDSSHNTTVSWSRGYNTTALTAGSASPLTLSSTITESGVQMVVSKATFSLTTPFASFLKPITGLSSYTYTRYGINRPRTADSITLN